MRDLIEVTGNKKVEVSKRQKEMQKRGRLGWKKGNER